MSNEKRYEMYGQRLSEARKRAGLMQKDVAKFLGVKDNVVSYYENGDRIPSVEQYTKLAAFFGVSADYLLCVSDAKTNDKDLQYVCDYTGFNEESVIYLKDVNNFMGNELNDTFYYEFLNSVIRPLTGKIFADVEGYELDLIQFIEFVDSSIKNFKNKEAFINMSVAESASKRLELSLLLSQIKEKREKLEFKKFKLQTSFGAAIDAFLNKKPFTAALLYDEASNEYLKAMALLKEKSNKGDTNADNN